MQIGSINQVNSILRNSELSIGDKQGKENTFSNIFNSALNLLEETNNLQQVADNMSMEFVTGNNNINVEDVLIASKKASAALQFTVELRNQVLQAYDEIMKLQV